MDLIGLCLKFGGGADGGWVGLGVGMVGVRDLVYPQCTPGRVPNQLRL